MRRASSERVRPRLRLRRGRVLSSLALRAPVRHARAVALRPRLDRRPAARAHLAFAPVDMSRAWHPVEARTHQPVRGGEDCAELLVAHVAERAPGRDTLGPERFDLPDVPDPRDEALVEQRVADLALVRRTAEAREHLVVRGRVGEDVRAEAPRDAAVELEHGAVPEHAGVLLAFQHEPRRPEDVLVPGEHAPASLHAQVAAQDEPALEAQQEVLADGLHAFEPLAVEPRRELLHRRPRMRRLDVELLTDEDLQPPSGTMQRVAFGHAERVCARHLQERSPRRSGDCRSRSTVACSVATTRTSALSAGYPCMRSTAPCSGSRSQRYGVARAWSRDAWPSCSRSRNTQRSGP